MEIRGTDFVAYLVSDLNRAATFYRDTLGLQQTEYREDWQWAEFDCGNITLTLYGGVELPEVVLGGRIALAVDDIQKAHEELKGKGVIKEIWVGTEDDNVPAQELYRSTGAEEERDNYREYVYNRETILEEKDTSL